MRLSEKFKLVYEPSTDGRKAKTGNTHAPPPGGLVGETWHFRQADLDLAGHVNNAAYWQALEQELVARDGLERIDAEIQYRGGTSEPWGRILRQGEMRWIVEPSGELLASILLLS